MSFLPGAKSILVEAGDGGAIRFHNVIDDRPVRELKLHAGRVRYLALSPDGKLAASTAVVLVHERPQSTELRVWNTESGEIVGSIDLEVGAFFGPVFAPDGKSLLVPQAKRLPGDYEEIAASVEHYGIREWKHLRSIETPGYVMSVAFCQNGKQAMLGGAAFTETRFRGPGKIWEANLGQSVVSEIYTDLDSKINHVFCVGTQQQLIFGTSTEPEFDRRGRAALSRQAKVVRSSLLTGKEVWASTSEDDRDEVQAIAVSPNGELVAWCTFGTILILDAERGRLLRGIGAAE
jgi:WD40 repeat protein